MPDYRKLRRPSMTKRTRAALAYLLKLAEQGFEVEVQRLLEDHGKDSVAIQIAAETYRNGLTYIRDLNRWHSSREAARERRKKAARRHAKRHGH